MWAQDLFDPNLTPEGVRAALDAGADVEASLEGGGMSLMLAAWNNDNPEVVLALLNAGADPSIQDNEGKTAWDLIQGNDALKDTDAYSELKDRSSDE